MAFAVTKVLSKRSNDSSLCNTLSAFLKSFCTFWAIRRWPHLKAAREFANSSETNFHHSHVHGRFFHVKMPSAYCIVSNSLQYPSQAPNSQQAKNTLETLLHKWGLAHGKYCFCPFNFLELRQGLLKENNGDFPETKLCLLRLSRQSGKPAF